MSAARGHNIGLLRVGDQGPHPLPFWFKNRGPVFLGCVLGVPCVRRVVGLIEFPLR